MLPSQPHALWLSARPSCAYDAPKFNVWVKPELSPYQNLIDQFRAGGATITYCDTVDTLDQLRAFPFPAARRQPTSFRPQTVTEMFADKVKGPPRGAHCAWPKIISSKLDDWGGPLPPIDVVKTISRWPLPRPISYIDPASNWRPQNTELAARAPEPSERVLGWTAKADRPHYYKVRKQELANHYRSAKAEDEVVLVKDSETGFSKVRQDAKTVHNDYRSPLDHLFRDAKGVVFLKPDREAGLIEIIRVGRGDSERQEEYLRAKGELITAYAPKILKWIRTLCKKWPSVRIDEVYSYVSWRLSETRLDKYNPNRAKLATYFRQVVSSLFLDYLRTIKPNEQEPISINANADCGEGDDGSQRECRLRRG
jgi:hypothetical protein